MIYEGHNEWQIPDDIIREGDLISVVIHERDRQIQIITGFFLDTNPIKIIP